MTRKLLVTLIALIVGALHFVTGEQYQGPFPVFVNGYLIDILLPMALFLFELLVSLMGGEKTALRTTSMTFRALPPIAR